MNLQVQLKFNPQEVLDCLRMLICDIPNLSAKIAKLQRTVNGRVLRPWCHFDIPESKNISSEHDGLETIGNSIVMQPPDPHMRVLEFASLGIKVKNTLRFHVLNPTNISYEFLWEPAVVCVLTFLKRIIRLK